jgi:hypothetical protein
VNVAASKGHTKLYADAYSVAPAGIFVPFDSAIRTPADLAGVPISVGYQSGSHYSTIQALEQYMLPDQINLSFEEGMLFQRLELFLAGKSPAVALFSGPYYFAEQLGFRKIIDNTFMIAAMINGDPEPDDIRKYFRALRRAQGDIDLRPDHGLSSVGQRDFRRCRSSVRRSHGGRYVWIAKTLGPFAEDEWWRRQPLCQLSCLGGSLINRSKLARLCLASREGFGPANQP